MHVSRCLTICVLTACGFAGFARGQLMNIDFSTASGPPSPAPSSAYGAAPSQLGFWNNITSASAAGVQLRDLAGSLTAATLTLTPGGFMFDGSSAAPNGTTTLPGSNDELLMDDVWNPPANATITIANLSAGAYRLFVYGGSPDSNTTLTQFTVGVEGRVVVGQWSSPFSYQEGITHGWLHLNQTGGSLVISIQDLPGFQSVNGLQLAVEPEPASALGFALTSSVLLLRRRTVIAGTAYRDGH